MPCGPLRAIPPPAGRPPCGGQLQTGCGRRRRCRRGPPAASTCRAAQRRAAGRRPASGSRAGPSSATQHVRGVCGACFSGLSSRSAAPCSMARISSRIAIIASQKRSSSAWLSLSVGSIISVPATGKRHRRRVEAVVDQPLGDVLDRDAGGLLERPQVEDALVRHAGRSRPCRAPGSAASRRAAM